MTLGISKLYLRRTCARRFRKFRAACHSLNPFAGADGLASGRLEDRYPAAVASIFHSRLLCARRRTTRKVMLSADCTPAIYTASTLGSTQLGTVAIPSGSGAWEAGWNPARLVVSHYVCRGRGVCETHHTFVVRGARHVRVVITEFGVDNKFELGEPSAVRF